MSTPESEKDGYYNEYLYARYIDLHKTTDAPEVLTAAEQLCTELRLRTRKSRKCLKVLICDFFQCYKGSPDRYLYVSMDANKHDADSRYNTNRLGYTVLSGVLGKLVVHEYLVKQPGYYSRKYDDGYQTRFRATEKLISLLDAYDITAEMIYVRPDKEILILKSKTVKKTIQHKDRQGVMRKRKVNTASLKEYEDHVVRKAMRNKLRAYIELLDRSYIDVDDDGYVPSADRRENIYIDLTDKHVRRIFNNGWKLGGRHYGGWWQRIPSDLRQRIIINGRHVVEIDYSGMHVHIMYAMQGLKLRDFNREPYIVSKYNDPDQIRPFIKRLFLTAVNCSSDRSCIWSVMQDVKENPENYPRVRPRGGLYKYLKGLLTRVKEYHPEISSYINAGIGLKAQYIDSEIASAVISELTAKRIPVLCVHDSFICRDADEQLLLDTMKSAYIKVVNREIVSKGKLDMQLSVADVESDTDTLIERVPNHWTARRALQTIEQLDTPGYVVLANAESKETSLAIPKYSAEIRDTKQYVDSKLTRETEQLRRQKEYLSSGKMNFNTTIKIESTDNTRI